jgi:hypothetical protein
MNKYWNKKRGVLVLRYISLVPGILLFVSFILSDSEIASFSLKLIIAWMIVSLLINYLIGMMPSREMFVQLAIQTILPMLVVLVAPVFGK